MSTATPATDPIFVGKLTTRPIRRRKTVAGRTPVLGSALLLLSVLLQPPAGRADTPRWQPVGQIAATAEAFLEARIGFFAGNTTVKAGVLDPRHRLSYCDEPLQAFMRGGTDIKARTIVGVRCSGSRPWKVYVPVTVVVMADVLVARQTLTKGHVLTAADLTLERRDVSRQRSAYLSELQQAVGQRLKTQLIAGKALQPSMIEADIAVRRGQSVTLTAGGGDFRISMAGTALADGALNQRIRVRNSNSGRIVEGIVRSREQVEILLSGSQAFFHAEPKVSPPVADTGFSNNDR